MSQSNSAFARQPVNTWSVPRQTEQQQEPAPAQQYPNNYQEPAPQQQYQESYQEPYQESYQEPVQQQPATQQPVYYQGVDPNAYNQVVAQNQAAAQEIQQLRNAVANLSQQANDTQRANALDRYFNQDMMDSLSTIADDDTRKIGEAVYGMMNDEIKELRQELAQQRQATANNAMVQQVQQFNGVIARYHPDYPQLLQSQEFRNFLAQRDGYSSESRDRRALIEYQRNNPAYLVDLINQFKSQRPNVQNIQSVAPSNTPGYVGGSNTRQGSAYTLKELNDMFQMGRITQDAYKEELRKMRQGSTPQQNR